ncbi:unnamed protein product [Scytosiphon promiscuus]
MQDRDRGWSPWVRRQSPTPSADNLELEGIPLADLRSKGPVANETQLVTAHPTPSQRNLPAAQDGEYSDPATISSGGSGEHAEALRPPGVPSAPSSFSSSSSCASDSSSPLTPPPFPDQNNHSSRSLLGIPPAQPAKQGSLPSPLHELLRPSPSPAHAAGRPPPAMEVAAGLRQTANQQAQQQLPLRRPHDPQDHRGPAAAAAAAKTGEYMRGIAAEARAWRARALGGAATGTSTAGGGWGAKGDSVDPVAMLLPDSAVGDRVGGPAGRGPLLRRLQTNVYGMLDDFVVVTINRPGPLYVRLKPDPRGVVVLHNFDDAPDDPRTSCPRLGPLESVGTVMPGDALASVNREVLLGRPFSECVQCIREASSSATAARPCVLCFRKADPQCLEDNLGAPPRSIEQEKLRILKRLLEGGEGGALDEERLKGITSTGVPDQGGLRPVLWRVLLRCVPANRLKWREHLEAQRALYARYVEDLVLKPAKIVTQGCAGRRDEEAPLAGQAARSVADDDDDRPVTATMNPPASRSPEGSEAPRVNVNPPARSREVQEDANGLVDTSLTSLEREVAGVEKQKQCEPSMGNFENAGSTTSTQFIAGKPLGKPRQPADDDPLSSKDTSGWAALWSDKELKQAIDQDVIRTMPDLAFFACRSAEDDDEDAGGDDAKGDHGNGDGAEGGGSAFGGDGGSSSSSSDRARAEQRRRGRERREALTRILFVHAKLNTAESYTQGMNEIVATLFFVLATDENEEWNRHCEADTFFCFTNLMSEIRDVFIQSMDDSESGLHGKMEAFSRTLRQHDPELADHMVSLALDPRYFALRWFTTLLSREFDLPDTIRLWDSLFAARDRSAFLVFVFVTLLMAQRETLLAGDFASNLQLLQAYPPTDVPDILAQSEALRLFSARGDAARAGELAEQRAREVADGAKQAAEQVNAAARRLWSAASDLAVGAAERVAAMNEVAYANGVGGGGAAPAQGGGRSNPSM